VIAAQFASNGNGHWRQTGRSQIFDNDAWIASLDAETAVTGPVLQKLGPDLAVNVEIVEPERWIPRADTVAQLAWQRYQAGERHDLWSLAPVYMRKSAAEEKLEQRAS
jgi:tRNA threonylcarbamoyladenosine biosynthesis protein TsaB